MLDGVTRYLNLGLKKLQRQLEMVGVIGGSRDQDKGCSSDDYTINIYIHTWFDKIARGKLSIPNVKLLAKRQRVGRLF